MSNISFDLSGKIALVTGATHGIGMAIAKGLAQQGAKICVNDIDDAKLESCKAEYAKDGIDVYTVNFNVTSEADVDKGVSQIEKEVGPIDILVNNAGIIKRVPILDMPVEDYKQVIDVDLVAPLIVAKRIAPGMIERGGGKIINMCSMMSVYGRQNVSAYASAKGGLKLLTANMCCEWARHNINVNGIGPGYIATAQTAPIRVDGNPFNELVMTRTPADRWGEPSDLAGAAILLSSPAGQFINGQVIYVDGGILANFGYVKGENDV
ncbi:gluconate 5-dehydrogenase [Coraliomargarita akajimensis]|uniref:Short-chain dehydrogenase/reductase SDR n=1 Tax=Coraliomargarita akajimensis (strain DSM 45221 / IAM 15411 / JCM 23193 / KCTC 12865 / 04OKA010-24) TaxID=583355 RepID=D5ELS7_CORAD|nr:gluconate 5-dehydrogenase [Coraliomargarita akajimensis]ADE53252.1 short-chain dehydrogenase/reductase SDR [Coraliomargarita akajimensis DSM 45221]